MGATFDKLLGELLLHKHKDQDISDFTVLDARYIGANDDIPYTQLADGVDGNLITWDTDGVPALVETGDAGQVLTSNGAGTAPTFQAAGGGGASTALDNLASVAINASLISDTDSTYDLGSSAIAWANAYIDTIYIPTPMSQTDFHITGWSTAQARHQGIRLENDNGYAYILLKGSSSDAGYLIFESDNYTKDANNHSYIMVFGNDMTINARDDLKLTTGIYGYGLTLDTYVFYPIADSVYSLGKSSNYWKDAYIDKLYLNATATLDGATAGQVNITGTIVNANIPTADPSVVGALWSDGGIVKVSAG